VTVGDYFAEFIERQHEAKLEALRAALIEGEQSGAPTPFDFDEFIERKRLERAQPK